MCFVVNVGEFENFGGVYNVCCKYNFFVCFDNGLFVVLFWGDFDVVCNRFGFWIVFFKDDLVNGWFSYYIKIGFGLNRIEVCVGCIRFFVCNWIDCIEICDLILLWVWEGVVWWMIKLC